MNTNKETNNSDVSNMVRGLIPFPWVSTSLMLVGPTHVHRDKKIHLLELKKKITEEFDEIFK